MLLVQQPAQLLGVHLRVAHQGSQQSRFVTGSGWRCSTPWWVLSRTPRAARFCSPCTSAAAKRRREIAGRFAHKWPTTTRHLRVLEQAGLLRQAQRGRTRIYRIDRERLTLVSQWLAWFGVGSPPS